MKHYITYLNKHDHHFIRLIKRSKIFLLSAKNYWNFYIFFKCSKSIKNISSLSLYSLLSQVEKKNFIMRINQENLIIKWKFYHHLRCYRSTNKLHKQHYDASLISLSSLLALSIKKKKGESPKIIYNRK